MFQKKSFHIIFLITLTFLLYLNSFQNDFTNWDDQELIINNPKIKSLSAGNIFNIFTSPTGADYLPLKEISYALDYRIWKLNPFGYHLTNLILYAGNIIVVYLIINLMFKDLVLAFLASSYFAIHPLHVESVAWLSARKDVLSGLFFFLSFYLYLKYSSEKRNPALYLFSLISFLFACLSKPVAVVLVLGIILYEITFKKGENNIFRKFVPLVPYFLISVFASFLTIRFGIKYATIKSYAGFNILKTFISFNSVLFSYLKKIIFPINLCALYGSDRKAEIPFYLSITLSMFFVLSVLLLLRIYQKRKEIFFCLAWFPLTLLPVSGIVPLSIERADRYMYIPLFGVSILVGLLFSCLLRLPEESIAENKTGWTVTTCFYILIVLFLSALTIERNAVWKDSFALWSDVIKKSPGIASAHNNLGNVFKKTNQNDKAIEEYKKAVEIDPENAKAHFNLASLYQEQGKTDDAVIHYREAIRINPDSEKAYNNLGNILMKEGRFEEALKAYKESVKISPDYFLANLNIGVIYYKTGQIQESIRYFEKAISLNPRHSDARYFAGIAYEKVGLKDKAFRAYLSAYKLNPKNLNAKEKVKYLSLQSFRSLLPSDK